MTQLSMKRKPMKYFETIFDVLYLAIVLISAFILYFKEDIGGLQRQFGIMAFVLAGGDAFHLIPRIRAMWDSKMKDYTASLGIGKLITSVTMTIFYILLWNIGVNYYSDMVTFPMTVAVYILAVLRIILCLFPGNRWASKNPPIKWAIWRNVPFFTLGMMVMILFAGGSVTGDGRYPFLWIAILISFACYLPVVLFSERSPKVGMLMLPKSCAYVAIVLMGFN